MIRIEMDLPSGQEKQYKGVEFVAKSSESYNPKKAADKLAEFLEQLYSQLPYSVVEILQKDPRIGNFRSCLTDRL